VKITDLARAEINQLLDATPSFDISEAEFTVLKRSKKGDAKVTLYLRFPEDSKPIRTRDFVPFFSKLGALRDWFHVFTAGDET
jgi:hypothetical protein